MIDMAHIEAIEMKGWNDKSSLMVRAVFQAGELPLDFGEKIQISWNEATGKLQTFIDNKIAEISGAPSTNGTFQKASEVQKKDEGITEKQLSYIQKLLDDSGNTNALLSNILRYNKVNDLAVLTKEQAGKAIDYLLSGVEE